MNIHNVRRWHGLVGVSIVLFWFYLLISGLIINHSDMLELDKKEISYPWLISWYGIRAAEPKEGYDLGNGYLSWDGDNWVLDDKLLSDSSGKPIGAVEAGSVNYVATTSSIFLYQSDGQLLDKIEKQSLPDYPVLAIGKRGSNVMLQTLSGVYATADGQKWEKSSATGIKWSSLQDLPAEVKERSAEILAPGISLQRVFQDVHSGRIFGRYAAWLLDIIAFGLLGLGLSGFWLYWRLR